MLGDAAAGVDARFKRFGLFFNVSYGVGATPIVDRVNVLPGTIQNNQSRVLVRGFNGYEFGAAYGQELGESGVMVGGAFKGIVGRVGFSAISAVDKDIAVGDIVGDFDHDAETSVRPGIDLGVLWKIAKTVRGLPADPTLGLVGRNLNSPKFDQPPEGKAAGERDLPLNAQVRGGASVSPLPFWRIALDLDLTENDTLAHHFRSRFISAGTEVNIIDSKALNLPLRFGITKNVAEGSSHVALTGGFGLNLAHATIDFALGASPSTENTDVEDNSNDVPTNFYAAIQVGATF